MSHPYSIRWLLVFSILTINGALDYPLLAQQPGRAKSDRPAPPAATQPAAKSADAVARPAAAPRAADAEAKAKIMAGDAWKQMSAEYQKWLAGQVIYTPEEVRRINTELAAQVQSLPASEMQEFLDDWQAKLKVLRGQDFQDAQQWLGVYLSAFNDGYRKKKLQSFGLTDVANMSAEQLEDAIVRIRAAEMSAQQNQAIYDQSQRQISQAIGRGRSAAQQSQMQYEAAQNSPARFDPVQSPYRPKFNPPPPPRQQFIVYPNGRIGYVLPW